VTYTPNDTNFADKKLFFVLSYNTYAVFVLAEATLCQHSGVGRGYPLPTQRQRLPFADREMLAEANLYHHSSVGEGFPLPTQQCWPRLPSANTPVLSDFD